MQVILVIFFSYIRRGDIARMQAQFERFSWVQVFEDDHRVFAIEVQSEDAEDVRKEIANQAEVALATLVGRVLLKPLVTV